MRMTTDGYTDLVDEVGERDYADCAYRRIMDAQLSPDDRYSLLRTQGEELAAPVIMRLFPALSEPICSASSLLPTLFSAVNRPFTMLKCFVARSISLQPTDPTASGSTCSDITAQQALSNAKSASNASRSLAYTSAPHLTDHFSEGGGCLSTYQPVRPPAQASLAAA